MQVAMAFPKLTISPARMFLDKSRYSSLHNLPIDIGIVPYKLFVDKIRYVRPVKFPKASRINPYSPQKAKSMSVTVCILVNQYGKVELRLLPDKSILLRTVKLD